MKKTILVLMLTLIAFSSALTIAPTHASTTATISVASDTQQFPSAQVGDSIAVNITVNNVENLAGWQISGTQFNPSVLSLTNVTEGPFLQAAGPTIFTSEISDVNSIKQGDLTQMCEVLNSYSAVNGSGVIATLTFIVLSVGTSSLTFNQTALAGPITEGSTAPGAPITCDAVNATLTIGNPSAATPTPTGANTSTPTNIPTNTPTTSSDLTATNSPPDSAPEFPAIVILVPLLVAGTVSILLITRKLSNKPKLT